MPKLVCLSGMNKGEEFPIEEGENTIGRSDSCKICIFDKKASRLHCKIFFDGGKIFLEDNGSTNGTKLNNDQVTGRVEVKAGDHIRLGQTVLLVSDKPFVSSTDTGKQHQQHKYDSLLEEATFQVTKTTALRKMRSEKEGRDVGFLSFFQKED
ncbi:MAG TPA: FHA domain-containing protein [Victivallales bacterium]|nr:FHA domain-containing protein [Victivallales bacterium]HPO90627.1 FHA domain-containing protein [Victivallales bacterium]HRR05784.1 FHA domain-containing protein [Victivallales bacterium]HRU01780.1 FHA domain-containing protein [Victivallales bacterium]